LVEVGVLLLLSVLMPYTVWSGALRTQLHERSANAVITVQGSQDELLDGYLQWVHQHPEVMHGAEAIIPSARQESPMPSAQSTRAVEPLVVGTPSIDLYSPAGISLYHGSNSDKNAAFIRALPRGVGQGSPAKTSEIRPTLQEAMEMFAELRPYSATPPEKNEVTVFALTFPDKAFCKAQNDAIALLKTRARRIGIRVIEVRLRK
jgi:hypothetical protein